MRSGLEKPVASASDRWFLRVKEMFAGVSKSISAIFNSTPGNQAQDAQV
jgi:hypothetical protein